MVLKPRMYLNKILVVVLCIVSFVMVSVRVHAEGKPGYYMSVRSIGGIASMDNVKGKGFANTLNLQNDRDEVAGLGGVIGYNWKNIPIHSEVEVLHRFRFDFDTRDDGPADTDVGFETNVDTTTVLFNLLLDLRLNGNLTPYIGGSIGWSNNTAETERRVINTGVLTTNKTETSNLAWGGLLGVLWDIDEDWGTDFAYRYINLGEVDTGVFVGGDSVSANNYISHDLVMSFFHRF